MNLHDLFDYDDGLLMNKSGHIYCNLDKEGYIRVRVSGKEYRAHRLIWQMFNGPIPEGMLIDHIDGDVYNNRIENLRIATRLQNNVNSKSNRGLPKGVSKVGNRYRARLKHLDTWYSLGSYATPEEAAEAYNNKANELHGEFAKVNNI